MSIHAPVLPPAELAEACRLEMGEESLNGCVYAFQVFDIQVMDPDPGDEEDHSPGGSDWRCEKEACVVRIFGVDADGRSVLVQAEGFEIPLFIEMPATKARLPDRELFRRLMNEVQPLFRGGNPPPFKVEFVTAARLGGYVPSAKGGSIGRHTFARLLFRRCSDYGFAQRVLKQAFGARVAEERVSLALKFCDYFRQRDGVEVDACGWLGVRAPLRLGIASPEGGAVSLCDIEIECSVRALATEV